MKVIVHADDLGICRGITDRIIQAYQEGCLGRTSIVPNGAAFAYAVDRLRENPGLPWSVHLNLVEGRCLAPLQELSLLVDRRGWFKRGFLGLLLLPVLAPWCRAELRRQVRTELDAQIRRVRETLKPVEIRIDSHRYVHLLPFVFAVLMERAAAWKVGTIRTVKEPFFTVRRGVGGLAEMMSPNLLKHLILRTLSRRCGRQLRRLGIGSPEGFLGVLYSGRMTASVADRGLKKMALRRPAAAAEVEVLFHPGPADPADRMVWQGNPGQSRFYFSSRRAAEAAAVLSPELQRIVASNRFGLRSKCIEREEP